MGEPPDRQWIVRDWIPCGVVTGLYGDGGLGKSLLAMQLQVACALGAPWPGLPAEQCPTLGVYCEDDEDELRRRQRDIERDYGVDRSQMRDVHWICRLGHDNVMMTFAKNGAGELTPFYSQVLEAARDLKARTVILDTVADMFAGNENDRLQVRQFVSRALGSIALATKGGVMACLHPSRAGLASGEGDGGSTGWNNTLRARASLQRPIVEEGEKVDDNARVLSRRKANYAARGAELRLVYRDGVIRPDTEMARATAAAATVDPCELFLSLVCKLADQGRPVSQNSRAGNYAPRQFAKLPAEQSHGVGEKAFAKAMEKLFDAGRIENAPYGRKGDERTMIAVVGEDALDRPRRSLR